MRKYPIDHVDKPFRVKAGLLEFPNLVSLRLYVLRDQLLTLKGRNGEPTLASSSTLVIEENTAVRIGATMGIPKADEVSLQTSKNWRRVSGMVLV
jgi:hypothetical protein